MARLPAGRPCSYGEDDHVEARKIAARRAARSRTAPAGSSATTSCCRSRRRTCRSPPSACGPTRCPVIRVTYRNIDKVHFRAVKYDWVEPARRATAGGRSSSTRPTARPRRRASRSWSGRPTCPPPPDYNQRTEDVPAPKELKPGFYFIVASPAANFGDAGQRRLDCRRLGQRPRHRHAAGLGQRARSTGSCSTPRPASRSPGRRSRRGPGSRTGGVGRGEAGTDRPERPVQGRRRRTTSRTSSSPATNGQELATRQRRTRTTPTADSYKPNAQTVFFTDRSLYRPGQTIQFKGICLSARPRERQVRGDPEPQRDGRVQRPERQGGRQAAGRDATTTARSAAASPPRATGSPGRMTIRPRRRRRGRQLQRRGVQAAEVPGRGRGPEGSRPKLNDRGEGARQGDRVHRRARRRGEGHATASTREVRYPVWFYECCWWRIPPHRGPAQEIAHGTAITEADGSFTVTFVAKPDLTRAGEGRADVPLHRHTPTSPTPPAKPASGSKTRERRLRRPAGDRDRRRLADRQGTGQVDARHARRSTARGRRRRGR